MTKNLLDNSKKNTATNTLHLTPISELTPEQLIKRNAATSTFINYLVKKTPYQSTANQN